MLQDRKFAEISGRWGCQRGCQSGFAIFDTPPTCDFACGAHCRRPVRASPAPSCGGGLHFAPRAPTAQFAGCCAAGRYAPTAFPSRRPPAGASPASPSCGGDFGGHPATFGPPSGLLRRRATRFRLPLSPPPSGLTSPYVEAEPGCPPASHSGCRASPPTGSEWKGMLRILTFPFSPVGSPTGCARAASPP